MHPSPSPSLSPGSPSVTHTYRPHQSLPHMLLHSTHSFLQRHRSLLAVEGHWVGEEHWAVGALLDMWGGSQRPHLSSRGVWCLPSKYSWLACHVLSIYPSVYDGIGRNVCHEESFLQYAILPTFAKVVCSVSPQDMWIATLPIVYSNLWHVACVEYC